MRDFEWNHPLWAVVKDNGNYAGVPCLTYEEARDLQSCHEGSKIFRLVLEEEETLQEYEGA